MEKSEKQTFSVHARLMSFTHAVRGIYVFFKTTHNAWVHVGAVIVVVCLGVFFSIERIDWIILVGAACLVFVAEACNTAIEIDINLTSPEYHPYARDTKDVAAGAVLIAAVGAVVIGILVFYPYIENYLGIRV